MATTTLQPSSLRLIHWNANGLKFKRQELQDFLFLHNVDVLLVSETHLRASDLVKIPSFTFYRDDRATGRGGGTGIFIRSHLDHYRLPTPALTGMEATVIVVRTTTAGDLKLASVYNPPLIRITEVNLDLLLDTAIPTLLGGDFNSKHQAWNSRVSNTNGRVLHDYVNLRNIIVLGPDEPTFYSTMGYQPDVLDIVVLQRVRLHVDTKVLSELDSDHNPVLVTLGEPQEPIALTFKKTSWPLYQQTIESHLPAIPTIRSIVDLEREVDSLSDAIRRAITLVTSHKDVTAKDPQRLPNQIRDLIREKNRARRRWQRHWDPQARLQMYRLQAQVRLTICDYRNSIWEAKLASLNTQDGSIWRMAKALKTRKTKTDIPTLHGRNGLVFTEDDKAEAFADSLEMQCTATWDHVDVDHVSHVHRSTRRQLAQVPTSPISHVTPDEVTNVLKGLKAKKAPGPDSIPNLALKLLPKKGIAHLVAIANASLRLRHFPAQWKLADVIEIRKPGKDPLFPQNYRPISLLPTLGKVLERLILTRLQKEVDDLGIIPDAQFGFRSQHSTTHQALRVVEMITSGFNTRKATGAVFLDISKAFDSVWHRGLVHKLLTKGVSLAMVQLIHSYLMRRTFQVKLRSCRSTQRGIEAGVPQGSVLSPLLFNIYVSDLPTTAGTTMAIYADDTAILTSSICPTLITRRLQEAADSLEDWYSDWRISVNPEKSAAVLFQKRRLQPHEHVTMFGRPIPWTNQAKYLGIVLDRSLTWRKHVEYVTAKTAALISALFPLLGRNSKLSLDNKLLLYKTSVRPVLTYASPVWGNAATSTIYRLQVLQNKVLRTITDSPWYVRNEHIRAQLQITTIMEYIRASAVTLELAMADHPNPAIAGIWEYDAEDVRRHKRPKTVLLEQPI